MCVFWYNSFIGPCIELSRLANTGSCLACLQPLTNFSLSCVWSVYLIQLDEIGIDVVVVLGSAESKFVVRGKGKNRLMQQAINAFVLLGVPSFQIREMDGNRPGLCLSADGISEL